MNKEKEAKKTAKEALKKEKEAKKEVKRAEKVAEKAEKKSEPPVWVVCPRCDLNYIDKKDNWCLVCKAEMGLADKSILIPEEDDVIEKICPVCVTSFVAEKPSDEICYSCRKEQDNSIERDWTETEDEEVDEDVKKVKDIDLGIDESQIEEVDNEMFEGELEEEEEEEEEEEFTEKYSEPDDFVYEANEEDFLDRPEDEDDDDELAGDDWED